MSVFSKPQDRYGSTLQEAFLYLQEKLITISRAQHYVSNNVIFCRMQQGLSTAEPSQSMEMEEGQMVRINYKACTQN